MSSAVRPVLARATPLLGVVALVALVALLGSSGSQSLERTTTSALVIVVVVVGLYVFVGNSGIISFGHIAFMAIGAYTTAWLTIPTGLKTVTLPDLPPFLAEAHASGPAAVVISGLVAAALAVVVAVPIMRLSGIAAGIATLSVLVIVNVVLSNWDALTGGTGTVVGVPTTMTPTTSLPWVAGALVVAFLYQESRWGRRLRASREDDQAARSVGIGVVRERRIAFVLSAFCVGAGGSLYAQYLGAFNPNQFYIDLTFLTLAMLVIGGTRSLSGAVVGGLGVAALSELLRTVQEDGITVAGLHLQSRAGLREIVLAVVMLVILVVAPRGLTGGRELRLPRRLRRRRGAPPTAIPSEAGPLP